MTTRPMMMMALALLLLTPVASAQQGARPGARRAYFTEHGEVARGGGARPRQLLHVETLNAMSSYTRHVMPKTIAIKVDRSTRGTPHTTVRIGQVEYDILSSRAANRKLAGRSDFSEAVGALYHVSDRALALYRQHFEDRVKAINAFNIQPFHFDGRQPAILKPGATPGTWEITNTRRAASSRIVIADLVRQDGRDYLQTPNVAGPDEAPRHVRVPVTRIGNTLELEQVTCASFVFSNLHAVAKAHPELRLPRFAHAIKATSYAAAKIADEMDGRGKLADNRRQNITVLYRDGKRPDDIRAMINTLARH